MPAPLSRRDFLKASASAAAMLALPTLANARGFGVYREWDRLSVAMVGIPRIRFPEEIPKALIRGASSNWITFLEKARGKELHDAHPEMAERLTSQMHGVVAHLKARGVTVLRPEVAIGHEIIAGPPSSSPFVCQIFPRDPWLVVGDQMVECHMAQAYREREIPGMRRAMARWQSMAVQNRRAMPSSAILEGGDVLLLGDEILVGISGQASNLAGVRWLQQEVGKRVKVYPVRLDSRFQHLDCALALPKPGLAIVCPEAFLDGIPATLKAWQVMSVSMGEALGQMACNPLILDERSLILPKGLPRLAEMIESQGIHVTETPLDMPALFGGGLRCMHLALARG